MLLQGSRIDNLPKEEMRKVRGKRIGMIFQDPLTSLNPLFRISEQLIETIQTHTDLNGAQARERAIGLLTEVGIPAPEKRIDSYPHEFSGGMRQRVVIALALAAEPELIIADEPTTALDVSVQAQIITLLKRLCSERGTAVMLVTHDMGVIAETADRVAVMYAGRIAEIGPVREVVKNARHPYAKGLMGAIPTLETASERLTQIPGSMPRLTAIPRGCPFNRAARTPSPAACRAARPDSRSVNPSGLLALPQLRQDRRRMSADSQSPPLVAVRDLRKVFDVSKPWLERTLERAPKQFLKAVDGVTFDIRRERLSRWWASPAPASRPWRGWSSASCPRPRER